MSFGINVTLVGMFVVFVALILLALIISLISRAMHSVEKRKAAEQTAADDEASVSQYTADEQSGASDIDMPADELIAVLTAAITAALRLDSDTKIRVSSFRRIPQNSPVWNKAGRTEYIMGKL